MGKSCGKHDLFSLGGQYYSLGQSTAYACLAWSHIFAILEGINFLLFRVEMYEIMNC